MTNDIDMEILLRNVRMGVIEKAVNEKIRLNVADDFRTLLINYSQPRLILNYLNT